jgi:hypothetical protein
MKLAEKYLNKKLKSHRYPIGKNVHYDFTAKEMAELLTEFSEQSKWIDVKDELPECKDLQGDCFSAAVLTINNFVIQKTGYYDYEFKKWTNQVHGAFITHWQPLPKNP